MICQRGKGRIGNLAKGDGVIAPLHKYEVKIFLTGRERENFGGRERENFGGKILWLIYKLIHGPSMVILDLFPAMV